MGRLRLPVRLCVFHFEARVPSQMPGQRLGCDRMRLARRALVGRVEGFPSPGSSFPALEMVHQAMQHRFIHFFRNSFNSSTVKVLGTTRFP